MKNREKTIYLYIGMPKTGSTSVQLFLYNNRESLEKRDIFYPVISKEYLNNNNNSTFINFRSIMFRYSSEISKNHFKNFNKFFDENYLPLIEKSKCKHIILSEEAIWNNNKYFPNMCDIMLEKGFSVKVIVYIRRPVEYLASKWQENLKPFCYNLSFNCSLNEFLRNANLNYDILENYINKLGKNNVIIRPFEKESWKNNDLYQDFLGIFNTDMFDEAVLKRANESPFNRNTAEFMLLLRSTNLTQYTFNQYLKEYAYSLLPAEEKNNPDNKYPETREAALKIIEKYQFPSPKIVDTIPQDIITEVTEKYRPKLKKLANYAGKENLFIKDIPDTKNISYTKTEFTFEQLEIIRKAFLNQNKKKYKFKSIKHAYDEMMMGCELPTVKEKIFSVRKEYNKKYLYLLGFKKELRNQNN